VPYSDISRAILDHLNTNPEAGDTLEGITEWWIRKALISIKIDEVLVAIGQLREAEIILEKKMGDKIFFSLNKDKLDLVKQLLSRSGEAGS
jgi:DNA-binding transcriptional ArsR family regulator